MLKRKNCMSEKKTIDMMMHMSRWSRSGFNPEPFNSKEDIYNYYKSLGLDAREIISGARVYIPLPDNSQVVCNIDSVEFTGFNFGTSGSGTVGISSLGGNHSGKSGTGYADLKVYLSKFKNSIRMLEESIISADYYKVLESISEGIGSIETYIMHQVAQWNDENPDKQLIDNKDNKVSFDDKIKK